jgi:S1-C subfamily serine protease
MKKHVIPLYSLVIILLIIDSIIFLYFSTTISNLQLELNSTRNSLQDLNKNQIQTQSQLNEITSSLTTLTSTQQSLTKQISELKASTSQDFSGIIEQAVKSVVSIKTDASQGSGFIISSEGYLVTNAHVLSQAHYAQALTSNNELKSASLIGYDSDLDVALLKITGNYNYLELADSDDVKVGEKVIAVGNPYGLSFSVTEGIVSAVNRVGINNLPYYFQTDVALNPGNSGGPLIDTQGKVIGMNNFKVSGGESLGFALESDYVKEAINNIALKALNQTLI